MNQRVTGHRLLRGAIVPGGAHVLELPEPAELIEIAADLAEIADARARERHRRRPIHRHVDTDNAARRPSSERSATSPAPPASTSTPAATTPSSTSPTALRVVVREGDVRARFCVRRDEFAASIELIHWLLDQLDGRTARTAIAPLPIPDRPGSGVGIVEGWRGTIVHRVEIDPGPDLTRVKIVDPSFFNWPALPVALTDTIVPDFPLTNKSFNLSYAGNDL